MPNVLKILKTSGTKSHFTTQQPGGVPTLTRDAMTTKKTSHIPSSGPSDNLSRIPSVAMSVNPSLLSNIKLTTFL